ncbi:MAG: DUF255 domain-containing protein [Myxococcota bacterium]
MNRLRDALRLLVFGLVACGGAQSPASRPAPEVQWESWRPEAFAAARQQGKHLLVSVQASWCHWCHVMNAETFGDPEVRGLLHEGFVAIKVDSDARPDLAERFQDYAWPATVLLTPDAEIVVALRGYRRADVFAEILSNVRAGREQPPEAPDVVPADLARARVVLLETLDGLYDAEAHGWGRRQKYPYAAPVEHAFFRGEETWTTRALETARQTSRLVDPVFGGAYQYSLRYGWTHPHYEKIAAVQADVLATFARAAIMTGDDEWQIPMRAMESYLGRFFSAPEGGFYTSQDADLDHHTPGTTYYGWDEETRLEAGVPRVDTSIYPNLNGRMIDALAWAARAGSPNALAMAERAANALERSRTEGVFGRNAPLVYLADQAWMLRAELSLYEVTGNARWLDAAKETAAALDACAHPEGGFYAHSEDPAATGVFAERRRPADDNAVAARGLIRLSRLLNDDTLREKAVRALRAVSDERELRRLGRRGGEVLMALEELERPYVLVSVVGPDDEATRALHEAALALPVPARIVELGRPGASRYPFPGVASAYLCNAEACSIPVDDPAALEAAARRFLAAAE